MANSQAASQQQLMMQVAQALQQGADPQAVAQQLMQMGYSQDQAVAIIQQVAGQGQMADGGSTNNTYYQGMSYAHGGTHPYMYTDPYSYMAMGGMIPKAANGMELYDFPHRGDYMDNEEQYQADVDAWLAENAAMAGNQDPTSMSAYANPALNMVGPQLPAGVTINKANTPVTKPALIDFITKLGAKSDFKTRASFAKAAGIPDYKGTSDQDNDLFQYLRLHADAVSKNPKSFNVDRKTANHLKSVVNSTTPEPEVNIPVIDLPTGDSVLYNKSDSTGLVNTSYLKDLNKPPKGGFGNNSSKGKQQKDKTITEENKPLTISDMIAYGLSTASVPAAGALAYQMLKENKGLKGMGDLYSGKSVKDLTKLMKNRGYRVAGDYEQLTKAGLNPTEAAQALKGMKFPKAALAKGLEKAAPLAEEQRLISNTKTAAENIKNLAKAYNNRFKTAKPILNNITKAGVRTAEDIKALKEAGLTSKEINVALKGVKLPEVIKAAGIGTKAATALKTALEASKVSKNVLGFLEGASGWFKEDGGSVGYVPNYGMAYGGSIYKEGRDLRDYTHTAAYTPGGWSGYPVDLPPVGWGKASYASGGQMPQWLAQRRFAAAGNEDKMSQYGYDDGGIVVGQEMYATPEQIQKLQQGGYQFEIMK